MLLWWIYPIILSFLISLLLSDVGRSLGRKLGFLDEPRGKRRKHRGGTSTLGGVAIFLAFSLVLLGVLFNSDFLIAGEIDYHHFIGFLLGGLILIIGGLVDDKIELAPKYSILFPVISAVIVISFGIGVSKITNPMGGYIEINSFVSSIVTFVWIISITYTTKLLDGLDGLAGGISLIAVAMIAVLALSATFFQPDVALLSLIAVGAIFGFLIWNTNPASIFLGEGGSTFVGYLIAVLAVIAGSKIATALLVVAVPLFDILFVIIARYKAGQPILKGDLKHLHHRLADFGLSNIQIVWFYYFVAILFGLSTLIFSSWQKLIILVALFIVLAIMILWLSSRTQSK